jgi:hypothetical protein
MEVLDTSINGQLLGCASAIQSTMDVHMWIVLGWLPVLHLQHLGSMRKMGLALILQQSTPREDERTGLWETAS